MDKALTTMRFSCPSREDSRRVAVSLAPYLGPGTVLTLSGDLGAGKTGFARDLAEGLGLDGDLVSSPTFTIVQEYLPAAEGDAETDSAPKPKLPVFHFDVYRLSSAEAFTELGLDEYFQKPGICLIEWAEFIKEALPEDHLALKIEVSEPETSAEPFRFDPDGTLVLDEDCRPRHLEFTARGPVSAALLDRWSKSPAFPADLTEKKPC